jgi:hypothetical protein
MRRRVVCPRSHPASLHAWRPSASQTGGLAVLIWGDDPPDPPDTPPAGGSLDPVSRAWFSGVRDYLEGHGVGCGNWTGQPGLASEGVPGRSPPPQPCAARPLAAVRPSGQRDSLGALTGLHAGRTASAAGGGEAGWPSGATRRRRRVRGVLISGGKRKVAT